MLDKYTVGRDSETHPFQTHFIDGKTEGQGGQVIYPQSHAQVT